MARICGAGQLPPTGAEQTEDGDGRAAGANHHSGYLLVGPGGRSWGFGVATALSSPVRCVDGDRVVAAALTPTGQGCWVATAGGRVLVRGDAPFWGDPSDGPLEAPVVDLAVNVSGYGYWLAASNGRVYVYGDAAYHGSHEKLATSDAVVGLAATADGGGYLLAARSGQVVGFGAAAALASPAPVAGGIADVATSPGGGGYWAATSDGAVVAYGDALDGGGPADAGGSAPLVGLTGWRAGAGYWTADDAGRVLAFGDAPYLGALPADASAGPIAAFAAVPGT